MATVPQSVTARLRAAMQLGDARELDALLHPEVRWRSADPDGGAGESREEVLQRYRDLRARRVQVSVVETFTYPSAVVLGLQPEAGPRPGVIYRVFGLLDEQVTEICDYADRTEALEAADRRTATGAPRPTEPAGDPACWLNRLCPHCDAVLDTPRPARCPRCGGETNERP